VILQAQPPPMEDASGSKHVSTDVGLRCVGVVRGRPARRPLAPVEISCRVRSIYWRRREADLGFAIAASLVAWSAINLARASIDSRSRIFMIVMIEVALA
jgi:hypothetical protein